MNETSQYILQDLNPGGYYDAIWTRDAAYILKDQFLSGANTETILKEIILIWSHQINGTSKEKIIYGRGSPETNFTPVSATLDTYDRFKGALPTTIYQDFSEIFANKPDIDSTALMISTTSWILYKLLPNGKNYVDIVMNNNIDDMSDSSKVPLEHSVTNTVSSLQNAEDLSSEKNLLSKVINCVVPSMLNAIDYLVSRDTDDDGLLEQEYNEDWMDTALRYGNIVYSQASWILALKNFSNLLFHVKMYEENGKMRKLAQRAISTVEQKLWSEQDGCYMDKMYMSENHNRQWNISDSDSMVKRTLTQDVSLYLVAITEEDIAGRDNSISSSCMRHSYQPGKSYHRAIKTFDALKNRIWKNGWPLVTEFELKNTGPWILKPHQYHNHTFWPWITGIEMLARSRFSRIDECNILLSKLASQCQLRVKALYEWIDPIIAQGNGAFPFRTGLSAIRIAISDTLSRTNIVT